MNAFAVRFAYEKHKDSEVVEANQPEDAAREYCDMNDNWKHKVHVVSLHTGEMSVWTLIKKVEAHRE